MSPPAQDREQGDSCWLMILNCSTALQDLAPGYGEGLAVYSIEIEQQFHGEFVEITLFYGKQSILSGGWQLMEISH